MSSKPRATAVDGRPRFQTPDLSGDDLLAGGARCGTLLEVVAWAAH
jgi:hypothetical protein